jgi:hypothetical protein
MGRQTLQVTTTNPVMPGLYRMVFLIVALVVLVGAGLFVHPDVVAPRWPWPLTPFNARFLGGIYLAELFAAILAVALNRWAPARLLLPQAVIFTAVVTLTSLVHLDRFDPHRSVTWVWFILYVTPMLILAYYLWYYRRWPPAHPAPPPRPWYFYLLGQGVVLGMYGVGLLVAPASFSGFWPWPIDNFHGQVYSAVFLSGAVGSFVLLRAAAPVEWLTAGLTQTALSLFAIASVVIVDAAVHRVDWSAVGTALWLGGFVVLLSAGLGMLWQTRRAPPAS